MPYFCTYFYSSNLKNTYIGDKFKDKCGDQIVVKDIDDVFKLTFDQFVAKQTKTLIFVELSTVS